MSGKLFCEGDYRVEVEIAELELLRKEEYFKKYKDFLCRFEILPELEKSMEKNFVIKISNNQRPEENLATLKIFNNLHGAVRQGDQSKLRELLDQGGKGFINDKNIKGETLLISAAYVLANRGADSTAKMLLNEGANINHQDNGGATALHIAIAQHAASDSNAMPFITTLLDNGPDISLITKKDQVQLQVVAEQIEKDNDAVEAISKVLIDKLLKEDLKTEKPNYLKGELPKYWDEKTKDPACDARSSTAEAAIEEGGVVRMGSYK